MTLLDEIGIIDADTHLPEPPDLWTSRLPTKWGDKIPHVLWDDKSAQEMWYIGDRPLVPVAKFAYAGWNEHSPGFPPRWKDADPVTWDAKLRLERMDEYGVEVQILYPNVALFSSTVLQGGNDAELAFEYIRAYNDFQTDWSSIAPTRLLPMTSLPFWDLNAAITEMERCMALGHKGIVFTQDPASYGLPALVDPHWDPIWSRAEEAGLPVNFHVASQAGIVGGATLGLEDKAAELMGKHAALLPVTVIHMSNARTLADIIAGGLCHRFPELNFVSVESDIGWIPYIIELLDWSWGNVGVRKEHPEYDLLPSEYFKRQIYGCLMFEGPSGQAAIDQLGDNNFLFETDFPHPGSMAPGPACVGKAPKDYMTDSFPDLPEASLRKIMRDNAARIYHLD